MEILTKPNDDSQFVELVSRIISGLVNDKFPEEIFVIQIDNWFDHKWLNFSGIGRVTFSEAIALSDPDTALDEFWQDKITFPPFSPNRIVAEYGFLRDERGDCHPSNLAPYVHSRERASSCENLHKRAVDFASSAVFVWFSSHTKSNRRGSVMVYEVSGSEVHTWFASFSKEEAWELMQTEEISRQQVQSRMGHDVPQGRT
jgi:hypothetical protein